MESEAIDDKDLDRTVNGGKSQRGSEGNLPPRKRRKLAGIQLAKLKCWTSNVLVTFRKNLK